ncbi:MAG TPA: hypothetical protein PKA00_15595 [Saprospiraceae bacterium]|nr:hypothetical protein [Saprospiraceae bacterium]HMQ84337.1 hypothetical protein [Saprospiraceae bacterium]
MGFWGLDPDCYRDDGKYQMCHLRVGLFTLTYNYVTSACRFSQAAPLVSSPRLPVYNRLQTIFAIGFSLPLRKHTGNIQRGFQSSKSGKTKKMQISAALAWWDGRRLAGFRRFVPQQKMNGFYVGAGFLGKVRRMG